MKITTVAYEQPIRPSAPRRGRPRTRGEKLRLREFFDDESSFVSENLVVYGNRQDVLHQTFDLLWQGMLVRFVLSKLADGSRAILISTDLNLTAGEIITAYGLRQKIEVSFKSLVHTLSGFGYHFWMKEMKKIRRTDGDQYLHRASKSYRAAVYRKLEAYERFVNIASIGLGILQVVGLKHTSYVWQRFPIWMRTVTRHGNPTEHVVRITLQHELRQNYANNGPPLMIDEFLDGKSDPSPQGHPMELAA